MILRMDYFSLGEWMDIHIISHGSFFSLLIPWAASDSFLEMTHPKVFLAIWEGYQRRQTVFLVILSEHSLSSTCPSWRHTTWLFHLGFQGWDSQSGHSLYTCISHTTFFHPCLTSKNPYNNLAYSPLPSCVLFARTQVLGFFLNLLIYLLIINNCWLHWLLIAAWGFSPAPASEGYSSLQWLFPLQSTSSKVWAQ